MFYLGMSDNIGQPMLSANRYYRPILAKLCNMGKNHSWTLDNAPPGFVLDDVTWK